MLPVAGPTAAATPPAFSTLSFLALALSFARGMLVTEGVKRACMSLVLKSKQF